MTRADRPTAVSVLDPVVRDRVDAVPGEDGVDLGQVLGRQLPAEGADVVLQLGHVAETDERGAHHRGRGGPPQGQLREAATLAGGQLLQLLDHGEVVGELLLAEEGVEEAHPGHASACPRPPVVLAERGPAVKVPDSSP